MTFHRRSRRARRAVIAAGVAAGVVALANGLTAQMKPIVALMVTCLAAVVAAMVGAITQTPDRGPDLDEAAEGLAQAVADEWRDEDERWQVHDPSPLPVRWQTVAVGVMDHWANVRRAPAGVDPGPLDLTGRLDQIVEVYQRIPSGRMVVLGRAGAGKTILILHLVLNLLATRVPADPVPVIFNLSSWNPTTSSLHDWLTAQLIRDHPGLDEPGPDGASLAAGLVNAGRILPFLDGFDEIASGLHSAALMALNRTSRPLLLTSRPAEYATAVAQTDVLTAAAGIELADLTPAELAGYLPRTARPRPTSDGTIGTVWDPVLRYLQDWPRSPAAAQLIAALATPLMVALARSVYSDNPGRDPAELLDLSRFPTPEAVEDQLLAEFVPAVYQDPPQGDTGHSRARTWDPQRAQRWLGWLAAHLDHKHTRDLAWWQLGDTTPRLTRGLAAAIFYGLVFALTAGLVFGLLSLFKSELLPGLQGGNAGLSFGISGGLATGIVFGAVTVTEPSHMQLRLRVLTRRRMRQLGIRMTGGLVVGIISGLIWGLVMAVMDANTNTDPDFYISPLEEMAAGLDFGILLGLVGGLAAGLAAVFEAPVQVETAVSPTSLLKNDRTKTILQSSTVGIVASVVLVLGWVSATGGLFLPLVIGLTLAFGIALMIGLSLNAWGRWLVLSRFWQPLTRRLPWAVIAFLEDACRRGVLRRAGPVYQFRHARLQDHLAAPTGHGHLPPTPSLDNPAPHET